MVFNIASNTQNKSYEFPLLEGRSNNWIKLEDDDFDIQLIFTVPNSIVSSLFDETNIIQTDENPIIVLNLEINYSEYDFKNENVIPIGNLKLNPNFKDIENLKLSKKINQESTLYFPGYAKRADIKSISFGKIIDNEISIEFSGTCIDIKGELNFEVNDVKIPISLE